MNTRIDAPGSIGGGSCWSEGCSIGQPVSVAGENLLIGVDVNEPLELREACLDLLPGKDRGATRHLYPLLRNRGHVRRQPGLCGETLDWWAEQARQVPGEMRQVSAGEEIAGSGERGAGAGSSSSHILPLTSQLTHLTFPFACGTPGSFPPRPMRPPIAAGCGCSIRGMPLRSNGKPGGKPTATASRKWPHWPTRRPFMGGGCGCTSRPCRSRCAAGFGTIAVFRRPICTTS